MNCPNCKSEMKLKNDVYYCAECNSIVFNVSDSLSPSDNRLSADMPLESFEKTVKENTTQIVLNLGKAKDKFLSDGSVDVDEALLQKAYDEFNFGNNPLGLRKDSGNSALNDDYFKKDIKDFRFLRMKFLRGRACSNEKVLYDIGDYDFSADNDYAELLSVCDEKQKAVYEKIKERCLYHKKSNEEISQAYRLMESGLLEDALTYAKKMCEKYPENSYAWLVFCELYYNCNAEKVYSEREHGSLSEPVYDHYWYTTKVTDDAVKRSYWKRKKLAKCIKDANFSVAAKKIQLCADYMKIKQNGEFNPVKTEYCASRHYKLSDSTRYFLSSLTCHYLNMTTKKRLQDHIYNILMFLFVFVFMGGGLITVIILIELGVI